MGAVINIEITKNDGGQRLDRFLRKYLANAPLSLIYKVLRKDVKVNGKRGKAEQRLEEGDRVSIYMDEALAGQYGKRKTTGGAKRTFAIAYEDADFLIVDKPYGLLTHGDGKEKKNHLANQVVDYLIEKGDYNPRGERTFVPAPANRLDRNTTGLVAFGKTADAQRRLAKAIKDGEAEKYYLTIVRGEVKEKLLLKGRMTKDESRNRVQVEEIGNEHGLGDNQGSNDASSYEAYEGGKYMETEAEPLMTGGGYSLLKVRIYTGRTHQIRAQLAAAGYPVIGDRKYGDEKVNREMMKRFGLKDQLLHAAELKICGVHAESMEPERFREIRMALFGDAVKKKR